MIIRPAIDLREQSCVQLVGGDYEKELFRLPDPVGVASKWIEEGFNNLHVIDLDRATGNGSNIEVIKMICKTLSGADIQVGGGLRSQGDLDELFSFGVSKAVVGTKAITDPKWLEKCSRKYSDKIYVALEVDKQKVKISGWQEDANMTIQQVIEMFSNQAIAGYFVTAIHVEGKCEGIDGKLFKQIRNLTTKKIVASGGISSLEDIEILKKLDIDEAVVGTAIYRNSDLAKQLRSI